MTKRIGVRDGYALAFGFSWHMVDEMSADSDRCQAQIDSGMRWVAKFSIDGRQYEGVSRNDFSPLKGIRTLSGAGQIATHPQLVGRTVLVLLEELSEAEDESAVAIVGLLNGNVIVDDCVPLIALPQLITEFAEACMKAGTEFAFVGNSSYHESKEEFGWADFVPAVTKGYKKVLQRRLEVRVLPLRAPLPWIPITCGVLVIAGLAGYWYYQDYQDEQARKAARVKREMENNAPKRYAESVTAHLAVPVLPANTSFAQLRKGLSEFPVELVGWDLSTVQCGSENCFATWRNDRNLSSFREFVEAAPKTWGVPKLMLNGVEIVHDMPFKLTLKTLPPKTQWLDQRTFLLRQFSQWQKYWIVKFQPMLEEAKIAALPDGMPPGQAAEFKTAIWSMAWTIGDTPLHLSEGFDRSSDKGDANLPDSVVVESMTVTFDRKTEEVKFKAGGKVYVRK